MGPDPTANAQDEKKKKSLYVPLFGRKRGGGGIGCLMASVQQALQSHGILPSQARNADSVQSPLSLPRAYAFVDKGDERERKQPLKGSRLSFVVPRTRNLHYPGVYSIYLYLTTPHDPNVRPSLLAPSPFSFVLKRGRSVAIENGMTTRFCYTYNITIDGEMGRGPRGAGCPWLQ